MQNWLIRQTADLDALSSGPTLRPALIVQGDDAAHRWEIDVRHGARDADLTGYSANAYFVRADESTVMVTGEVDGHTAAATLTPECYAVPGRLLCIMRLTSDANTVVVGYMHTNVVHGTTDTVVDPGNEIPSLEALLAKIAEMEAAIQEARDATERADQAAEGADTSAGTALDAAVTATNAADTALASAASIDNMTVAAHGLTPSSSPTATISDIDDHKHIDFGLVKGDQGEGLIVRARYDTEADLRAAHPTGEEGDVYAVGIPELPPMILWFWNVDTLDWDILGTLAGDIFPINGIYPGSAGYEIMAEDIPTSNESDVQAELDRIGGKTGEDIPVSGTDSRAISDAIYRAKETFISDRVPDGNVDNASVGAGAGDRWVAVGTFAENLIGPWWKDLNSWAITITGSGNQPTTGIRNGVSYISLSASNNPGTVMLTRNIPALIQGHKYFIAAVFSGNWTNYRGSIAFAVIDTATESETIYASSPLAVTSTNVYAVGNVFTISTTNPLDQVRIRGDFSPQTAGQTVGGYFEGPILIDLTEIYGAGYEPDATAMNALLTDPATVAIANNIERYFERTQPGQPNRAFVCVFSDDDSAIWQELVTGSMSLNWIDLLNNPLYPTTSLTAGFTFQELKFRRELDGSVRIRGKVTLVTARSAAYINSMITLTNLPMAGNSAIAPAFVTTSANALSSGSRSVMIEPSRVIIAGYTNPLDLVLNAVTATTANAVMTFEISYFPVGF